MRSKPSSQKRRYACSHSAASRSPGPRSREGRNCALRPRSIRPARSSTRRCLETACTVIGNGRASSLTVASPSARRPRMARRVGSARAAKVASSCSESVFNSKVEYSTPTRRDRRRQMGRIVVTEFVSLDGVIEDPGGAEDYKHGGWSFEIQRGDEGDKFKLDETMETEALLLGRVTYEGFADAWPSREGEFADKFNQMPKYVVSATLSDPEWTNSTVIEGDLPEEVARLKEQIDGDIVVHGSAMLAQTLLEDDPGDELRLMVFPVVLGEGKRLFGETSDKKALELVDSRVVGDGVSILVYRPAEAE